jgi:hypothetical protein
MDLHVFSTSEYENMVFGVSFVLCQVKKAENTAVLIRHADHVVPCIRRSWH